MTKKQIKKKLKLEEKIAELELEMIKSLQQKDSSTEEISLADYLRKINELRKKLASIAQ